MDAKDLLNEKKKDITESLHEGGSQIQQSIKREIDSLDDFEHLEHDISPLKEFREGDKVLLSEPTREFLGEINKGVVSAENAASKLAGELKFDPPPTDSLFNTADNLKMDTNLLDLAETFPDRKEADAKLDKFLSEISSMSAPTEKELKENVKERAADVKSASQNFMDMERGGFVIQPPLSVPSKEFIENYSDSDTEDDLKPSIASFPQVKDVDYSKTETFKDVDEFELPKASVNILQPTKVAEHIKPAEPVAVTESEKGNLPEPVKKPEPTAKLPEPAKSDVRAPEPVKVPEAAKAPEPVKVPEPLKAPEPEKTPEPAKKIIVKISEPKKVEEPAPVPAPVKKNEPESKTKIEAVVDAEAMFCKMGLDAWFIPEKLNPKVADLIYWRDPKKSGPVFAGVLIVLLALTYFSLISVVAYLSLLALTGTISFRIYKNIVQAVQKTGDGHPFKEVLETDVALPQDKVEDLSKVAVAHINAAVVELRRLFLVEDLVDSIKFGVLLWCLTYLGAWFNGMTLIIIAWVALFTLPKVYETNKTQIDANLDIVRTKLEEITSKVRAAIPIGKKPEEKKQQ